MGIDNGYLYEIDELTGEPVYVHRKIMEQKLGRKLKPGEIVHHKDEIKLHNDPDNLELTNRSKHAKHHWTPLPPVKNRANGERVGTAKLKDFQVIEIKKRIKNGESNKSIATKFNVHHDTIRHIRNGWTWKHIQI